MVCNTYRGTSLIRNRAPLESYSRTLPRALWWSYEGGRLFVSEVPLYGDTERRNWAPTIYLQRVQPLSSKHGAYKTVKDGFRPWRTGTSP